MITSNTGISLEILISIAAGVVAWVGSYMTTKTKVDNLQYSVKSITGDITEIFNKLQLESKAVREDTNKIITKLEEDIKSKLSYTEKTIKTLETELFNTKLNLQKEWEEKNKTIYGKLDKIKEHTNNLDLHVRELQIIVKKLNEDLHRITDKEITSNSDLRELLDILTLIINNKGKE